MSDSERLNRIIGIQGKTPQEILGCPWGIPILAQERSWRDIQQDVHYDPHKYEYPLDGFKAKLRIFAERFAREHNYEEKDVIDYVKEQSKRYFYSNGKPKFTVTKRKTNDSRLLAWDFEWVAARESTPLATTESNEKEFIHAMPATAILVLDGQITELDEGAYHIDDVIDMLEIPGTIEEQTEALYVAAPWCIVSGTTGMADEDTIHTEIAFVVNTLEIAFDVRSDYLSWQ